MQIWSGQIKVLRLYGIPAGHMNKRDEVTIYQLMQPNSMRIIVFLPPCQ